MLHLVALALALAVTPPPSPVRPLAGLEIKGPTSVPPYRLVKLEAVGVEAGSAIDWSIDKDAQCDVEEVGNQLLFVGPPGEYLVTCVVFKVNGTALTRQKARVRVTIEANTPRPPPATPPRDGKHQTKEEAERALCRLTVGTSGCTCTIIGPRRADGRWDVFSAAHCWHAGTTRGTITLQDGRRLAVTRAWTDRASDGCWMITDDARLEDLPHAFLASSSPPVGTAVWQAGYGVATKRATRTGAVSSGPDRNGQLFFGRLPASSGDSGGGIFRSDTNEVVASVFGTKGGITCGCGCSLAGANRPK